MLPRALLVLPCAGILACADGAVPAALGRPNMLLVSIDTLRADHLGYHGYGRPTSPELDAFADSAIVFENAQASAPWTLPALASIFTSTYTSTHGCWSLGSRLDESFQTLPELMTSAGYDSAVVASHRLCAPRFGISQGFVHNDFELCDMEGNAEQFITSDKLSERGIRFLNQKQAAPDGKPWLLWVHYFDPHDEYMPQPEHKAAFLGAGGQQAELDLYDGEIAFTDQHVGRLLAALKANGQDANTVVVFFSDHGEEFLDHGQTGHALTLYREMLHVPLVLRIPGRASARIPQLVRTVDLMPTLLELCGLEPPTGIEGLSLLPLIDGVAEAPRIAFSEAGMRGRKRLEAAEEGNFKWIQAHGEAAGALYDLASDPGERVNVAEQHPERAERLAGELKRLREGAELKARGFAHAEVAIPPDMAGELGKLGYTEASDEEEQ